MATSRALNPTPRAHPKLRPWRRRRRARRLRLQVRSPGGCARGLAFKAREGATSRLCALGPQARS
eukprot:5038327-Alexandrium_andersonii.AAC.1